MNAFFYGVALQLKLDIRSRSFFPVHIPRLFLALALYLAASLGLGAILGLAVKSQAKLTTVSQIIFLPSIMLSGTMFPTELLPEFLKTIGKFFPATWGYRLMLEPNFPFGRVWYLLLVLLGAAIICILLLKKQNS
ncbi:MAG: ABC transporter permease [Lachnospiraceae bacterium]|nr:ABC transporter permease [Lachnospiraceae bacterium]